tara:strand:- start:117 stop:497 length:381 start_codon:yes stop_codon:yes gene_type:complete
MAVELDNKNLKVIKLGNGEIIFSKVQVTDASKTSGYLELHWPMKVLMKFDDEAKVTQLALLKWLPFTDNTQVPLSTSSIQSVSDLGINYQELYLNSVNEDNSHNQEQELSKISTLLRDFEPTGYMN